MNLDSVGKSKDESTVYIKHPATGKIIQNDDKSEMSITLYGEYSQTYQDTFYERTQARIQKSRETGETSMSYQDMEEESFEVTVRCTKDWNLTDSDGPVELTEENVRRIYKEYPWVYQQARVHMENSSNFLEPSVKT